MQIPELEAPATFGSPAASRPYYERRRDGRRVYAWSADCRLQHTETATDKVKFLYDGQGRRLAKTVTRRDAPGSPVATFYVWDGWTVVEEIESARDAETGVWAETVVAEYLPGLGLDDHIVAFLHGEEIHFHQDHLGSVLMLTDADGAVLQRYRYDIHGNATVLDAAGNVLGGLEFLSPVAAFHRRTGAAPTLGSPCAGGFPLNRARSARPTARVKPVSHGGTEARRNR